MPANGAERVDLADLKLVDRVRHDLIGSFS
jgi:hypothetical protein